MRRIAIMVGAGFVPGMNAVVMGAALAAGRLGWESSASGTALRGLLHPERYPEGGLVTLSPKLVENLDPAAGGVLGQSAAWIRSMSARSTKTRWSRKWTCPMSCWQRLKAEKIDALIPSSAARAEHSLQAPPQRAQYGLHPPLHRERHCATSGLLWVQQRAQLHHRNARKARQAAQSARKIAVVEVLGEQAGWLALQAGIAVCADAVLIPEIPCDLQRVVAAVEGKDVRPAALRAGGGGRRGEA
jgi:ATP-dependent phosphofructokinase / diphosphate-dependent phosphofructokinase